MSIRTIQLVGWMTKNHRDLLLTIARVISSDFDFNFSRVNWEAIYADQPARPTTH